MIIPFGFIGSSGGGYTEEYQAVLDYAVTNLIDIPSVPQSDINNAIVANLITEEVWDKLDLFYMFKQETGLNDFIKINWRDPDNYYLTSPLEPTYDTANGLSSNVSGKHMRTGFTPSTDVVFTSITSSSVIFKVFGMADAYAQSFLWGADDVTAANDFIGGRTSELVITGKVFGSAESNLDFALGEQNSHWHISDLTTVSERYRNGVLWDTKVNQTSGGFTAAEIGLLCINITNSNYFTSGGFRGLEYWAMGSSVGDKDLEIYQILNGLY